MILSKTCGGGVHEWIIFTNRITLKQYYIFFHHSRKTDSFLNLSRECIIMPKTEKTQKQRFVSFRNGFCPYCGTQGALLNETKNGYHAICINPVCKAENPFTHKRVKEWTGAE